MKKGTVSFAAVCFVFTAHLCLAQGNADTILYNGKILTVDEQSSVAEAVAVSGDRILAVGSDEEILELAGPDTLQIDLKGKTVTPGLIHTHVHMGMEESRGDRIFCSNHFSVHYSSLSRSRKRGHDFVQREDSNR